MDSPVPLLVYDNEENIVVDQTKEPDGWKLMGKKKMVNVEISLSRKEIHYPGSTKHFHNILIRLQLGYLRMFIMKHFENVFKTFCLTPKTL